MARLPLKLVSRRSAAVPAWDPSQSADPIVWFRYDDLPPLGTDIDAANPWPDRYGVQPGLVLQMLLGASINVANTPLGVVGASWGNSAGQAKPLGFNAAWSSGDFPDWQLFIVCYPFSQNGATMWTDQTATRSTVRYQPTTPGNNEIRMVGPGESSVETNVDVSVSSAQCLVHRRNTATPLRELRNYPAQASFTSDATMTVSNQWLNSHNSIFRLVQAGIYQGYVTEIVAIGNADPAETEGMFQYLGNQYPGIFPVVPPPGDKYLLENGSDSILLEDGASFLVQE